MRHFSIFLAGLIMAALCLGSGVSVFDAVPQAYAKKASRLSSRASSSRKVKNVSASKARVHAGKPRAQGRHEAAERADDIRLTVVRGVIKSSFARSLADQGEKNILSARLARIWSSDIDFLRGLKKGDRYSIVVEKRYGKGRFLGYGRILGGRFINRGRVSRFYFLQQKHGPALYFDECGESMSKVREAPLAYYSRISSGYTMKRRHPIFRRAIPHQAVDYAAPVGTPVTSIADGEVTAVGWRGGFGRSVRVRHTNGVETMYSHLSRYAKGMKPGLRVRRGQYLGNVGRSGIATGPHLDFRALKNGRYINPARVCNPRRNMIRKEDRKAFDSRMRLVNNMIGQR